MWLARPDYGQRAAANVICRDTVPQDNYPPLVVVVGPPGRLDGVLNIIKSEDGGSGTVVEQPPTTARMCHTADQKQISAVEFPASR